MDPILLKHMRAGHQVVTVNNRLARFLAERYDEEQMQAGLTSWARPQVMSLVAWADARLGSLPDPPTILSRTQCLYLWERAIEEDLHKSGQALLQIPQTALRAHEAHQLLIRYDASFSVRTAAADHQAFLGWRDAWKQSAFQQGWHDPAETLDLLAKAFRDGRLAPPECLILAGFDDMLPDVERLQQALRESGAVIERWTQAPCPQVEICCFEKAGDPVDEIRSCGRWARALLENHPDASIGIVVPQLETYRHLFETIFLAELDPQSVVDGQEIHLAFNLSLPHRLGREGVVRAALSVLEVDGRLELERLSWLLRSPYLGDATTLRFHRARLDRVLRENGQVVWSLGPLRTFAKRFAAKNGISREGLLPWLDSCEKGLRVKTRRQPGDWAEHFLNQLHDVGWPGDRPLSSREFQAVDSFQAVFREMAKLDGVSSPIGRNAALKILQRLVAETPFQPETPAGSVQILGLLETTGLTFDYLWVPGLHDGALPQPSAPNPFIPLEIQRRSAMPRADAERERMFACRVADRLFRAAPHVVLSWPQSLDGLELRRSPLLSQYSAGMPVMAPSASPHHQMQQARAEMDKVIDVQGPGLNSRKPFSGGTGILKDQALCPFRAFAHYRLRARELASAEIGFDNLERGSLVHHALEFFWKDVRDQACLIALAPDALDTRLRRAVERAMQRFEKERRRDIPRRQRLLEETRLLSVLHNWLTLEKERAPFRVKAVEQKQIVDAGGLRLSTRIDRVDLLADGGLVILDYKTGHPDPALWFDDRLTEPQLPLYCLTLPREQIAAVLFAQVHGRLSGNAMRGIVRDPEAAWPAIRCYLVKLPGNDDSPATFDDVLDYWQKALAQLGKDFAAGDAQVDPIDRVRTCRYCDLHPLCRIHDRQSMALVGEAP